MRKKLTLHDFIEKATQVHNGKYDYSFVNYKNISTKVKVICPLHGEFWQIPDSHLRGIGCKKCGYEKIKKSQSFTNEEFIERANKVHSNYYDYSKTFYSGAHNKVIVSCPIHGDFQIKPANHLHGQGCSFCGHLRGGLNGRMGLGQFIKRSQRIHGKLYDYSKVIYKTKEDKVEIICPKHGSFFQTPGAHLHGKRGCPKCGIEKRSNSLRDTLEEVIEKAKKVHGDIYDYSLVSYYKTDIPVEIICKKHGSFWQRMENHLLGQGCPKCGARIAKGEIEIGEWLQSLGVKVEYQKRNIFKDSKKEIDVYLPEYKVGVEHNGLVWHSTFARASNIARKSHFEKRQLAEEAGVRLLQFWDFEWRDKRDICKDIILFAIGKIQTRLYARHCIVKEVPFSESQKFLEENHIQGQVRCNYRIGLYKDDQLVGLQCYQAPTKAKDYWVLARTSFLKGTQVIGGISKMFLYFVKNKNPVKVVDYTDLRLFDAHGHYAMNFSKKGITAPCLYYVNGRQLFDRGRFWSAKWRMKHGWDKTLTIRDNMRRLKYAQIWDAGKLVNVWEKSNQLDGRNSCLRLF